MCTCTCACVPLHGARPHINICDISEDISSGPHDLKGVFEGSGWSEGQGSEVGGVDLVRVGGWGRWIKVLTKIEEQG